MIGRLRGTLIELTDGAAVIDVGGVGYELEVTGAAAAMLAAATGQVTVYTHMTTVRDDAQQLYGFANAAERDLFRALIKVSKVGPKLGVAMLSVMAPEALAGAIASGDVDAIVRVPGVGKKTAGLLVIELKDRVGGFGALPAAALPAGGAAREAVLALTALGYGEPAAARVVAQAAEDDAGADTETLVRHALRRMAAAA